MASTSSSSSTEAGQNQEPPDWVLPIYPESSWASNIDFLIMVIRRVDRASGPDFRQLQGCLECISTTTEQDATSTSFTMTDPTTTAAAARSSMEVIQAGKTRFKRRWTTQGKPCTELIRKTIGLDEIPSTQIDLLFVFRAVVPAGSWAFHLDKTSGAEPPCLKDNQVCNVQVSAAMNAVTCARLYEGSIYVKLRDVILRNNEERKMFAEQLKDFQYLGKPIGSARGEPATQIQVWPKMS